MKREWWRSIKNEWKKDSGKNYEEKNEKKLYWKSIRGIGFEEGL